MPDYQKLLDYPITAGEGRVLYLAMDRPKQVARSFRRMVGEAMRHELNERLIVWKGPPPQDLAKYPSLLARLCDQAEADTVILDSIKDAALKLSDDDVGAAYNRARQTALRDGVQVAELHHLRKALAGAKAEKPTIDDVYGSTWITAGAGSVILLNGSPGDPIVSLHHLKQPVAEVGPLKIIHDRQAGLSSVWHSIDLVLLAGSKSAGITAKEAAELLYDTTNPTPAQREKARSRLEQLEHNGHLVVVQRGDPRTNLPTRWSRP